MLVLCSTSKPGKVRTPHGRSTLAAWTIGRRGGDRAGDFRGVVTPYPCDGFPQKTQRGRCLSSWERLPPIHGAAFEEIERPEIADALGQAAMAVGVGVDEAGMIRRRLASMTSALACPYCPGCNNVGDVARLAARRRDRMHQSAFDHEHYAHLRQCLTPRVATPRGDATAQQPLFLNGLIVALAIGIHNGRNYPCRAAGDRCGSSP